MNAPLYSVADVAAKLKLKAQGNGKFCGAPQGTGATKDGFILCPEGNAFTNGGTKYTSREVAELAEIDPAHYEPVIRYQERNGHANGGANGAVPSLTPKIREPDFNWSAATKFDYRDENGDLLFQVGRIDHPNGSKDFRQRRPNGRGWIGNLTGVRRVLFNLPDVMRAEIVAVHEGEKSAIAYNDDLKRAGLYGREVATTTPQGASNALKTDLSPLHEKTVALFPDNNTPGKKYRDDILNAVGELATCKVVELPHRGDGGDYVDFRAAGGTLEQARELMDAARVTPNPATSTNPTNRLTGHSAFDLLATDFPEPKWIVEAMIPEGLAILGGHPKLGKSWAMLSTAVAIACGGRAFGQIEVEAGDVLYLALEDTRRRMKSRLAKQLAGARPEGLQRLHIEYQWPRNDEGGLDWLRAWLSEHPEARLIVVDTLQKIKPRRKTGGSVYESDSDDVGDLKALSDQYGVAIVCVHHLRKSDGDAPVESLSGSYGLSGAADTLLILKRERGQADATLYVTGRDVDESEHALNFDKELAQWNLLGDASQFRLTNERQDVVNALQTMGEPVTPTQLWQRTGVAKNLNNLRQMLWKMSKEGEIYGERGKYSVSRVSAVSSVTAKYSKKQIGHLQSESYQLALDTAKDASDGDNDAADDNGDDEERF